MLLLWTTDQSEGNRDFAETRAAVAARERLKDKASETAARDKTDEDCETLVAPREDDDDDSAEEGCLGEGVGGG